MLHNGAFHQGQFTICQSTNLGVSGLQRIELIDMCQPVMCNINFITPFLILIFCFNLKYIFKF